MKLNYRQVGGHEYASIPGKSYREDGRVKKTSSTYLGRVIDKENNVFFSKERGLFTFDAEAGMYGDADPKYLGCPERDQGRKPILVLDFGDAYFVDALLHQMHYDKVLDAIPYKNKDALWAMVQYYILSNNANSHALTWYLGSFANVLYPNADPHSQRISRLLSALGKEDVRRAYFGAHIGWVKEYICDDPAIIIDSTGLPNAIQMNLTETNCHNGKLSTEARMVTALQRDSGYPLLFRVVPDNIVDVTTLSTTIVTLGQYGIATDLALLDAGYVSKANLETLFAAQIEFVARLPETSRLLYRQILTDGLDDLKRQENLVEFNGRYVYVKQLSCEISGHDGYAYLCFDVDASADENHKAIKRARKKKQTDARMHRLFEGSGIFILISSLPFKAEDILIVYYLRQLVEQYYDIGKGLSRMTPLRVHNEQRVLGHLLMSQIAATVNLYIQKAMRTCYEDSEEMFLGLRNQKCIVYPGRIVTNEGQSDATKYYNRFKIKYPVSFDTTGDTLQPNYGI